ncbi:MAG: adenylosuccinate synthetase [Candidatus Abawacabacteria bacterium]|nr:adenylosuccinate synthetase [Candidatus Abawacabacteria bacterium]
MSLARGSADCIVGLGWGDEGKGRVVHKRARGYEICGRGNGGSNAGHTLVLKDGRKIVVHALPSGVVYPDKELYIGSGCVVNPIKVLAEIADLRANDIEVGDRLHISVLATTVTPLHVLEDKLTGAAIGTTGNGIGQAYTGKVMRSDELGLTNLRVSDVLSDPQRVKNLLHQRWSALKIAILEKYQALFILYCRKQESLKELSPDFALEAVEKQVLSDIDSFIESVKVMSRQGWLERNAGWMNSQLAKGKRVLGEGAQAIGIDVTYGVHPYVTSSNAGPGAVLVGMDVAPQFMGTVTGVIKAIASRVGNGPFVGEFGGEESEKYCAADPVPGRVVEQARYQIATLLRSKNPMEVGIALRMLGDEYGATTGRPRRLAPLNVHKLQQDVAIHGIDDIVITKLDRLADFSGAELWHGDIPVIAGYELGGEEIDYEPTTESELRQVVSRLELHPRFLKDISGITNSADLPLQAQAFVRAIAEKTRASISAVGVGPGRDQLLDWAA